MPGVVDPHAFAWQVAGAEAVKDVLDSEDVEQIKAKTETLAQLAMKLGEAMYKAQQAETEEAAGPDAGTSGPAEEPAGEEEVVDAEFSEVDEGENKGG